ncbi:MAG: hypothetical protein AB4372_31685 [Xenococcus sp. (in: cyanobacteria)]
MRDRVQAGEASGAGEAEGAGEAGEAGGAEGAGEENPTLIVNKFAHIRLYYSFCGKLNHQI